MTNQTPELCLEAVKKNGLALKHVDNKTHEICLEAVKQNGMALKRVPRSIQTLPIAIAALKQNPECRKYLAVKFQKPEVYKAAGCDYELEDLAPSRTSTERERTEIRH